MKKLSKRFLTLAIACVMAMAMAVPAFAAPNGTFTSSDIGERDTPHGHYFHNGNYYLNQWGSSPVSGTRVTTCEKTGDITQAWDIVPTTTGHWVVTTNAKPNLALNIYRSGSQPEVNVIAYMENDYNDCVLTYDKLTLAYQTGTYANFGVTMTSQNTNPYNTYGRICRWTGNPTNWTHVS